jgi:hypothetical protein
VACPKHRCTLIKECPECGKALTWFRRGILTCKCRANLINAPTHKANDGLVELMALIHAKLHGKPISTINNSTRLPLAELSKLSLRSLLFILPQLGRFNLSSHGLNISNKPMVLARSVVAVLRDWPVGYHQFLRRLGRKIGKESPTTAVGLRKQFDKFYGSMFKRIKRFEGIEFMREEFVRFGLETWGESVVDKKLLRGKYQNKRFISKSELASQLGVRRSKSPSSLNNLLHSLFQEKSPVKVTGDLFVPIKCKLRGNPKNCRLGYTVLWIDHN